VVPRARGNIEGIRALFAGATALIAGLAGGCSAPDAVPRAQAAVGKGPAHFSCNTQGNAVADLAIGATDSVVTLYTDGTPDDGMMVPVGACHTLPAFNQLQQLSPEFATPIFDCTAPDGTHRVFAAFGPSHNGHTHWTLTNSATGDVTMLGACLRTKGPPPTGPSD
jgi:hypothetical protein